MPLDIAKMLGALHQSDLRNMRFGRAIQEQYDRRQHTTGHAHLDPEQQGHHNSDQDREEITGGVPPGLSQNRKVHQRQHRDYDSGGQRGLRQVIQERGKEHCRQRDPEGGKHTGHLGFRPRIKVDYRARETTGNRKAAG